MQRTTAIIVVVILFIIVTIVVFLPSPSVNKENVHATITVTEDSSIRTITCDATGGYLPYSFLWQSINDITSFSLPRQDTSLFHYVENDQVKTDTILCQVTDGKGNQFLCTHAVTYD